MRATLCLLAAVVLALTLTAAAQGWFGCCSAPTAENAFSFNCCYPYPYWGTGFYGPISNWPPPCQPFQGFASPGSGGAGPTGFATHPFARSPRDYFMIDP